jgi:hypothetical protein
MRSPAVDILADPIRQGRFGVWKLLLHEAFGFKELMGGKEHSTLISSRSLDSGYCNSKRRATIRGMSWEFVEAVASWSRPPQQISLQTFPCIISIADAEAEA